MTENGKLFEFVSPISHFEVTHKVTLNAFRKKTATLADIKRFRSPDAGVSSGVEVDANKNTVAVFVRDLSPATKVHKNIAATNHGDGISLALQGSFDAASHLQIKVRFPDSAPNRTPVLAAMARINNDSERLGRRLGFGRRADIRDPGRNLHRFRGNFKHLSGPQTILVLNPVIRRKTLHRDSILKRYSIEILSLLDGVRQPH